MLGLIRVILLLLIIKVPKRLRSGKFSSLTISLSDKSIVSNWSCHMKKNSEKLGSLFNQNQAAYKKLEVIKKGNSWPQWHPSFLSQESCYLKTQIRYFGQELIYRAQKKTWNKEEEGKNFILGFGGRKKERIPRRSNSRSLMALKKWGLFQIKSAVSLTIFLLNSTDYYFEAG